MKYRLTALLLAAVLSLPMRAESVPEGESRKLLDRQTELLSARLLFKEALERYLAAPLPDAAELLARRMKEQPGLCVLRADAERRMRPYELELLQQRFQAMAEATLAPFRVTLPADAVNAMTKTPETLLRRKCDREFPAAFAAARNKLVAEQRAEITETIYPTEAELEQNDDKALTGILTRRFAERRGAPLWEELLPQLQAELIAPMLKSARDQQQRQLRLAGQLTPDARLWAPEAAAADLERQLNAEIAAWQGKKRYALFPRTRALVKQRSCRLPQERVIALLPGIPATPGYAEFLAAAPAGNANPEISFRAYAGAIAATALDAAEKQLRIPEPYRVNPADDAAVERALERRFLALRPELQKLRDAIALDQLKKRFPAVADRSFHPAPEAVEAYREDKTQIALPAGADDPLLLDETQRLLRDGVTEQLAGGNAELSDQLDTVEEEYDAVVSEMEKLREQSSPSWLARWFGARDGVDLDTIRDCYTARVLKRFRAAGKRNYPDLFPRTKTEIDLRTRAIFQRLSNPATPLKPKPPETKEAGPIVTYHIAVDTEGDRLLVRLKKRRFTGASESALIGEVAQELDALCRRAAQESAAPPRFIVRIEVGSGAVYYRFVAELREALKETLRKNGATVEDVLGRSGR